METNEDVTMRLQRYLAIAGVASRRACEHYIEEGRVSVNGMTVNEQGTKVGQGDVVLFDGKPVRLEEKKRYIVLNKPAGYVCTMADPDGRQLAADLVTPTIPERVYNIGRLDQWSSGLILFTNDGIFASALMHPSGGIEKEYEVLTDGAITSGIIQSFTSGIEIDGTLFRALRCFKMDEKLVRVVLIEGKNREIRRVFEHLGLRVLSLRRIRIGILGLDVAEGKYRELEQEEIEWFLQRTGKLVQEKKPGNETAPGANRQNFK